MWLLMNWLKRKKIRKLKISFDEIIKNIYLDAQNYFDDKKQNKETFSPLFKKLSCRRRKKAIERLKEIRKDIEFIRYLIKTENGLLDDYARFNKNAQEILKFLTLLRRDIENEIALYRRDSKAVLKWITETDWSARRRKKAEKILRPSIIKKIFSFFRF